MTDETIRRIDHSALRTNQAFIITLLVAAFITNLWPLVAFVSAVMIVGTIWPSAGLFKRVYRHVLKPLKVVRPDVIVDNPEPHLFAQGLLRANSELRAVSSVGCRITCVTPSEANLRKYNEYTHSMIKVVAHKSEEASVGSGTRRGQ